MNSSIQSLPAPKKRNVLVRIAPWLGSAVILMAMYSLFASSSTFTAQSMLDTLSRVGWHWAAVGFLCVLAQTLAQGTRLWALLPSASRPSWIRTQGIFSFGQVMNSTLPARIGDVVKVGLLGSSAGAGSVFIADKVVDAVALATVGAIALAAGIAGQLTELGVRLPEASVSTLSWGFVLIAATGVSVRLGWPHLPHSSRQRASAVLGGLWQGSSSLTVPSQVLPALAMGILSWSAELLMLRLLCSAAGHSLPWGESLAALLALNLGIAIPVSVANIGTFEAALSFALTRFGVPAPEALAIAALHHAIQLAGVAAVALGFHWANRRARSGFHVKPEDKFRAMAHYESLSKDYNLAVARGPLKLLRQREHRAIFELANLQDPKVRTVIDVGCGGGFYALAAKRAGKHVTATDLSPGMIDRLSGKVDEAHVSDVETFSPGRTYDLVICAGVLDFVLNPTAAFANLCSLVSPDGGRLVVMAPRQGWGGLLYRLEKSFVKLHVNLYREKWFKHQAAAHGLRLVATRRPLPGNQAFLFLSSDCKKGRQE